MTTCTKLTQLTKEFKECQKAFTAMGDETRQQIIIALLECDYNGIRVGEITKRTHLSQPAVSHHLQILKDANIINMRREGTKNYYFLDADKTQWKKLLKLMELIVDVADSADVYRKLDTEY